MQPKCDLFTGTLRELKERQEQLKAAYTTASNPSELRSLNGRLRVLQAEVSQLVEHFREQVSAIVHLFFKRRHGNLEDGDLTVNDDLSATINNPDWVVDFQEADVGESVILPTVIQHITGELQCIGLGDINCSGLQTVGSLNVSHCLAVVDFESLQRVTGSLKLMNCKTEATSFCSLVEIGGVLILTDLNNSLVSLPNLVESGEIKASQASTLALPKLRRVRGSVFADAALNIHFDSLQQIEGALFINRENRLVLRKAREWNARGLIHGGIRDKDGIIIEARPATPQP